MDKSNNKKRILALIQILRKKTDSNTRLKLNDLVSELKALGIDVNDRKTLYDDFKVLNEYGFNVEYDNGYYMLESPFNLSEIKIIIDSINSLKNLNNNFLNKLNNKMYSYISEDEEKLLEKLKYVSKHKDTKLLLHMEDVLNSISNRTSIVVQTVNNPDKKEIFPLFLHRANDYYYFYYHYPNSDKIYHYRFDNIKRIELTNNIDEITISRNSIIKKIEESSKSYSVGDSETIIIDLVNDDPKLIERFLDDFPNAMRTKDGFALKADLNNVFYSKLVEYQDNIIIKNKDVVKKYLAYLNKIIKQY